jgi:hypothetical protein
MDGCFSIAYTNHLSIVAVRAKAFERLRSALAMILLICLM